MIIFDLDGTLADCEHRRHFVENKKNSDWKAFFEACDDDIPIWPVIYALMIHSQKYEIQIWSGRCESVRNKTEWWLTYVGIDNLYSKLKMRQVGDYTPDDELKESWLREALERGEKIEAVYDDRPKVVRMWRRNGIFVFDCNQSGKEF